MSIKLDDLYASPDHFLHSFDGDGAVFVPMDRAAYHRSIFLDRRISPAARQTTVIPITNLVQQRTPPPIGWIFHMAHCGSTLLARALDDPDASLVLREPLALRQCAINPNTARLTLVMAMLGKRYREDVPTLVKANVPVNFLLPQLALASPDARAVMLYLPLRAYLLAILRSADHRTWLRNVTGQLAPYIGDVSSLSDAQLAAALWLAQITLFSETLSKMPNARALDAELFFAKPAAVLKLLAPHLGLPLSETAIDAAVTGPLFATYSKNPSFAFDNAARVARQAEAKEMLGPELDQAEAWIASRAGQSPPDAALRAAQLMP